MERHEPGERTGPAQDRESGWAGGARLPAALARAPTPTLPGELGAAVGRGRGRGWGWGQGDVGGWGGLRAGSPGAALPPPTPRTWLVLPP